MIIKICGIRRPEDIIYVNEFKPDYIGFVFAESKRRITAENAAELKKSAFPGNKSSRRFCELSY